MSTDRSSPGYIPNTPLSRAISGAYPTGTRQTNTSLYPGLRKENFTVKNPSNIVTAIIIVVILVLIILVLMYLFGFRNKCKCKKEKIANITYPQPISSILGGEDDDSAEMDDSADLDDFYEDEPIEDVTEVDEYIEGGAGKKTAKKTGKKAVKKTEAEKIAANKTKITDFKAKIKLLNKNLTPANKKKIAEITKKIKTLEKKNEELKKKKQVKNAAFII